MLNIFVPSPAYSLSMAELLLELLSFFVEPVLRGLLYGVAYCVGWFVIAVLTAGTLPMASILDEGRGEYWHSLTFVRHGRRYVLPSTVVLVGMLTVVLMAIEGYMLYRGA
jgi:hypothetical protein